MRTPHAVSPESFTLEAIEDGWAIPRKVLLKAVWDGQLPVCGSSAQGWLVSLEGLGKWLVHYG